MVKILKILALIWLGIFIFLESLIFYTASLDYPSKKYDYLVILGSSLEAGKMSLALKYRLDKALEYLQNDQNIAIVVSGAGDDDKYLESSVMKDYLVKQGIAENRIIQENQSYSTYQNLANTYKIVKGRKILVVTSDFHMFRVLMIAKKLGFEASPLNAKTPADLKIKMYLREFIVFFASYLLNM